MAKAENILKNYLQSIGKRVHEFRKEKNYPLEELGFRIGLDRSSVRRIEIGEVNVTVRTLLKLAIALEKEPADFLQIPFNPQSYELGSLNKAESVIKKKTPLKKSVAKKRKG